MHQLKHILLAFALTFGICNMATAQLYLSKAGKVHFFSKTPIEDIEATSDKAEGAFKPATGQISARIPIKTFTFEKALMQRHFNENYLESDKYPYSSLEGKLVEPLALRSSTTGTGSHPMVAKLTLHGVTKEYTIPVEIEIKDGVPVRAKGMFQIKLVDHNIDRPKIVLANIAETIDVNFDFLLEPKA